MNERMTERMIDTHSAFLILDLSWTKLSAFCYPIFKVFPRQALSTHVLVHLSISFIFFMFASSPLFIRTCLWQSVKGYYKMIQDFKNSNIGSRTVNEIISHLGTAQHILLILLCHCHKLPTNFKQSQGYNTIKRKWIHEYSYLKVLRYQGTGTHEVEITRVCKWSWTPNTKQEFAWIPLAFCDHWPLNPA